MVEYLDSNTVRISLTPSAIEQRWRTDAATVRVTLTPTYLEERTYYDAATVRLTLTVTALEEHRKSAPLLLVKNAYTKLSVGAFDQKISLVTSDTKWKVVYVGKAHYANS